MIDPSVAITAFVTMFVVVDPVGLTPLFVALTRGMDARTRRGVAMRSCAIAFGILSMFAIFGDALLGFAGISMAAFKIAGGLLLILTALDMLFQRRTKRREDQSQEAETDDPSVFPLAIPLIAGPGAIATTILLVDQAPGLVGVGFAIGVSAAVLGLALGLFFLAGALERALGKTGIDVVTRILGMLLAALSVQFILDGVQDYLGAL